MSVENGYKFEMLRLEVIVTKMFFRRLIIVGLFALIGKYGLSSLKLTNFFIPTAHFYTILNNFFSNAHKVDNFVLWRGRTLEKFQ